MFDLAALPLARVPLSGGPTAIERIGPDTWVKREDRAGSVYGGNKVRKLEWLLGAALETGGDVLTVGTVGSNHLVATAVYGQASGADVHAVVAPQPDAPTARINARILHAHAEKLWVASSAAAVPFAWAKAEIALRVFGGYPPATFPIGGSNALGCVGWVGGGLELAAQVAAGELPAPDRIYVALGSGGTAAGLLVGLRLAGIASEVVAVRAAPSWLASPLRVRLLARRTLALLRRHGAPAVRLDGLRVVDGFFGEGYARPTAATAAAIARAAPSWLASPLRVRLLARRTLALLRRHGAPAVRLDGLRVVDGFFGEGYARPTAATAAAIARAAELGLALEATYTAKAFAAMEAEPGGTRLFLHTANSRPLAPLLATAMDEVPPSLAGLLTR